MLDSTSLTTSAIPKNGSEASPVRITGNFLAKSKSLRVRLGVALHLINNGPIEIEGLTVAQIARLCRVPRAMIDKRIGRGSRCTSARLARTFQHLSAADRIEFVRMVGVGPVWDAIAPLLD
jgi:hypothetical protein